MSERELVLAIGKFDALHIGHRALARRAAGQVGSTPAALLTFTGMAAVLGWPTRSPLIAPSDRARVLVDWSIGLASPLREVTLPFDEVRPLAPAAFLALLVERFAATGVVVGEDFRFGHQRSAGVAELRDLAARAGLAVDIVGHVAFGAAPVSSSRVRAALERGDCAEASACLGRPHRLVATVVRGEGRGRSLGFATANCGTPENQAPAGGVYAGRAWIDGRGPWPAAVNAGHVPTVAGERPFTVEAHLIGFNADCYGARIEIDLLARLREERRFPDLAALAAQIRADVARAAEIAA